MARPLEERLAQKLEEVKILKEKIKQKEKRTKMPSDEAIFTKLLDVSSATYYNKKKNNSILLKLFKTYFSNKDLQEFLETGSIQKLELIKNIDYEELEEIIYLGKSLIKIQRKKYD